MTLARWNRLTEWPLAIVAFAFLGVYAWEVIGNLRGRATVLPDVVQAVIWMVFVIDYLVCLALARPRGRWFVRHLPSLLVVMLPFLRPLRLLRLLTLVRVLRRATGAAVRGRVTLYVIASATLLVIISALAELDAEQNAPGSNIRSFGDAVWWACTTITTIGYGDHYPVTIEGRMVAVGLMVAGVALIGTVTATFATWFIDLVRAEREVEQADEE